MPIRLKRAYEPVEASDGRRYLVDRLWPRGCTAARLHLADWAKEVAPSEALRREFHHDPGRFDEFARRYRAELDLVHDSLAPLVQEARTGTVTLVFAARDAEHSNAAVLATYLAEMAEVRATPRSAPRSRRA